METYGPAHLISIDPTDSQAHANCSHSASVEVVDDQDSLHHHNVDTLQDPNTILESVYDDEWESLMERSRSKASASTKGKGRPQDPKATSKPIQQHRCSASVEDIDDQDNFSR